MSMTPDVIKAAREYERFDDVYSGHQSPSAWDVLPITSRMASFILKHSGDYDAEGKPLPVDEGFVLSLGGEEGNSLVHLRVQNGEDDLHVIWVHRPMSHEPQLQVVLNGAFFRKAWTRPQLRALLAAMGR